MKNTMYLFLLFSMEDGKNTAGRNGISKVAKWVLLSFSIISHEKIHGINESERGHKRTYRVHAMVRKLLYKCILVYFC